MSAKEARKELLKEAFRELVPWNKYPVLQDPWSRANYLRQDKFLKLKVKQRLLLYLSDGQAYTNGQIHYAIRSLAWNQRKNELRSIGFKIEMVSSLTQRQIGEYWYRMKSHPAEIDWENAILKTSSSSRVPAAKGQGGAKAPALPSRLKPNIRAKIHVIRQQLGISDQEYRDLLYRYTGKRSCEDLNNELGRAFITQVSRQYPHLENSQTSLFNSGGLK